MEKLRENTNAHGDDLLKQINEIWTRKNRRIKKGQELDFLRDVFVNKLRRVALAKKYNLNPNSIHSKIRILKSCLFDQIVNGDEQLYQQLLELPVLSRKGIKYETN